MLKEAFLVLLAARPAHGYELKVALERRLAGLLPALNDGQVYTTLSRLERDGLIESAPEERDARGKRVYCLTSRGRQEAVGWLSAPAPEAKLRDEFLLKFALCASSGLADATALIDAQRQATLESLRGLDALPVDDDDALPSVLREGVALHLQARLRWLDVCEERLGSRMEESDETRP